MVYRVDHWCCHSAISWASLAVRLLAMRAGMLLLLALRRASAAEPCALCMAAHPNPVSYTHLTLPTILLV